MESPELIFVTGCNAAGKSTVIRNHLNEFPEHQVIMTDEYKERTRDVFKDAVNERKSIILETPFNDESFKDLIDRANNAHYYSSLLTLFLRSPAESLERVAKRQMLENGLYISSGNVELNFIEGFKNVAKYFSYFDESRFAYTGEQGRSKVVMRFEKDKLMEYHANDLIYVQRFADQAYRKQVLDKGDLDIIALNKDYKREPERVIERKRFRL